MEQEDQYTGLLERVKAVFVDSLVLVFSMVVFTQIFSIFEQVPDIARILAFTLIFVLYDPLCVSFFAGTLGHRVIGIQVKDVQNETKNIGFLLALIRFTVKVLLGWISLLTITGNVKRRAIHDMVAGSVVVYTSSLKE
ncbi:MAG TPA: RDD family protein [Microscillaceae bacterium]|nr:RDD family protein [Microscillaceae bacterium]